MRPRPGGVVPHLYTAGGWRLVESASCPHPRVCNATFKPRFWLVLHPHGALVGARVHGASNVRGRQVLCGLAWEKLDCTFYIGQPEAMEGWLLSHNTIDASHWFFRGVRPTIYCPTTAGSIEEGGSNLLPYRLDRTKGGGHRRAPRSGTAWPTFPGLAVASFRGGVAFSPRKPSYISPRLSFTPQWHIVHIPSSRCLTTTLALCRLDKSTNTILSPVPLDPSTSTCTFKNLIPLPTARFIISAPLS